MSVQQIPIAMESEPAYEHFYAPDDFEPIDIGINLWQTNAQNDYRDIHPEPLHHRHLHPTTGMDHGSMYQEPGPPPVAPHDFAFDNYERKRKRLNDETKAARYGLIGTSPMIEALSTHQSDQQEYVQTTLIAPDHPDQNQATKLRPGSDSDVRFTRPLGGSSDESAVHPSSSLKSGIIIPFKSPFSNFGSHKSEDDFPEEDKLHSFLKRGHEIDEDGLYQLHKACIEYPYNAKLIGMMIRSCSEPVTTPVKLKQEASKDRVLGVNSTFLKGMFPIHIAVANNASLEVVKLLVRAGPHLLALPDGNGMIPLSLLFRFHVNLSNCEYFSDIATLLIQANPGSAKVPDKRMNYPLHYLCMAFVSSDKRAAGYQPKASLKGTCYRTLDGYDNSEAMKRFSYIKTVEPKDPASSKNISSVKQNSIQLQVLKLVLDAYPAVLHKRNFNGDTPLDLAQNSDRIDDDCISFLHNAAYNDIDLEDVPDVFS